MSASKASLIINSTSRLVKNSLCLTDKYLVIATEDGVVTILDTDCTHINQKNCEHRRTIYTTYITQIACLGDLLVIGCLDGQINLFSLESGYVSLEPI
jgi:hypothetical protein